MQEDGLSRAKFEFGAFHKAFTDSGILDFRVHKLRFRSTAKLSRPWRSIPFAGRINGGSKEGIHNEMILRPLVAFGGVTELFLPP